MPPQRDISLCRGEDVRIQAGRFPQKVLIAVGIGGQQGGDAADGVQPDKRRQGGIHPHHRIQPVALIGAGGPTES